MKNQTEAPEHAGGGEAAEVEKRGAGGARGEGLGVETRIPVT